MIINDRENSGNRAEILVEPIYVLIMIINDDTFCLVS